MQPHGIKVVAGFWIEIPEQFLYTRPWIWCSKNPAGYPFKRPRPGTGSELVKISGVIVFILFCIVVPAKTMPDSKIKKLKIKIFFIFTVIK